VARSRRGPAAHAVPTRERPGPGRAEDLTIERAEPGGTEDIGMSDSAVEALTQRLDRMERGLRRWRVLGVIGWAILAASLGFIAVVMFWVPPATDEDEDTDNEAVVEDEVRARTFVLVDEEDRPRAALAMRPDGTPALAFSTSDGRIIWKAP
jgi:hypothetical protein